MKGKCKGINSYEKMAVFYIEPGDNWLKSIDKLFKFSKYYGLGDDVSWPEPENFDSWGGVHHSKLYNCDCYVVCTERSIYIMVDKQNNENFQKASDKILEYFPIKKV